MIENEAQLEKNFIKSYISAKVCLLFKPAFAEDQTPGLPDMCKRTAVLQSIFKMQKMREAGAARGGQYV